MIKDLNDINVDNPLHCDLCIIGSGAAGITIAREFADTEHLILVLEGGGRVFEHDSQDPYRSEIVGLNHTGIHEGRARVLGGTTTLWAGQTLPLFDIDFSRRRWIPYSGWPIRRIELEPYYRRAEVVLEVPTATYDARTWPQQGTAPPEYDPRICVPYYSQFTNTPDFSRKYGDLLEKSNNITVLTHANAVCIEVNHEASAATGVRVRSLSGVELGVRARFVVVCCGGIDSARLLLNSDSVEPGGIGNRHDVVGRFFQDHPGVGIPIRPRDRRRFSRHYDSFRKRSIRYVLRVGASPILQEQQEILHVGAEVYYPSDESGPLEAAKRILKSARRARVHTDLGGDFATTVGNPGKVLKAAWRHYVRNQPPSVGSTQPYLGVGGEQAPNPNSRVTLSRERDGLGQRRAVLDWRLSDLETRSIEIFTEHLSSEWDRLDIADIGLSEVQLRGRESGKHGGYVDGNHHIGTTRMGADPRTSVVDARCRVHGYENLYIGSSSVFPTGGGSNPTFTILALCLRIADDIKAVSPGLSSTIG